MNRRELLKQSALISGGVLSLPFTTAFLSGCGDENVKSGYKPIFFQENEFQLLANIIDVILPETESPSASKVGVHQRMDNIIGRVYESEDQKTYKSGFDQLKKAIEDSSESLEKTIKKINKSEGSVNEAFSEIRSQTVSLYLVTEEIGRNFLNYLPVPGEYEGCVSTASVDNKAWAI